MAKASHRNFHHTPCESLEPRQLLSASFSNTDLTGPWAFVGMSAGGSVQFDGAGAVSGGSVSDDTGQQDTPTGAYFVSPAGKVTVSVGPVLFGALNSAKDVVTLANSDNNSLALLVSPGSATFSNADLSGTWNLFVNGDPSDTMDSHGFTDNSGHGSFTFNGNGNLTGTFIADQSNRKQSLTGAYSVNTDGSVSIHIQGLNDFTGQINASKNLVALNPADLAAAASDNNSRLIVLVKPGGSYSKASLNGSWTVASDKTTGTLTFNGKGHLTGTINSHGSNATITGTYTISSTGAFSITAITKDKQGTHKELFAGAISSTHDLALFDKPNSGQDGLDDLITLVSPASPPLSTLSVKATRPKASELKGSTSGRGQFTLTRTGGDLTTSLTVHYTLTGTATNGVDYSLLSGTVTFSPKKSTVNIVLNPLADSLTEGTESAILTLSPDAAYTIKNGTQTATISIADAHKK